jgi:hypothetical protein
MRRSLTLTLTILTVIGGTAFSQTSPSASAEPGETQAEPLGVIEVLGPGNCDDLPDGYTICREVKVRQCKGGHASATIAVDGVADPPNPIPGMVSLFSGVNGASWWVGPEGDSTDDDLVFIEDLRIAGYRTAQVKWEVEGEPMGVTAPNSWLESHSTDPNEIGPQRMACRPATVIKYLWDEIYKPMLDAGDITDTGCGFCISGNSGGASQIAYSIVYYDLQNPLTHDVQIGGLFPTSGPIHTNIQLACNKDEPDWLISPTGRGRIDASYIWDLDDDEAETDGKCRDPDEDAQGWITTWTLDSIEELAPGGGVYSYPTTRVEMILGGLDDPVIWNHACEFFNMIEEPPTPKKVVRVPGMDHRIQDSDVGLDRLYEAIVSGLSQEASCTP